MMNNRKTMGMLRGRMRVRRDEKWQSLSDNFHLSPCLSSRRFPHGFPRTTLGCAATTLRHTPLLKKTAQFS